jgi:hypothetical protein
MEVNTLTVSPIPNENASELTETRYRVSILLTTVKIVKEA